MRDTLERRRFLMNTRTRNDRLRIALLATSSLIVAACGSPASTPDGVHPTIVSVTPPPGAAVPADSVFCVVFSEPMDASTITTSSFQLYDHLSHVVSASVTYDAETRAGCVHPNAPIAAGTQCDLYVAEMAPVRDLAGNELVSSFHQGWTIAP